MSLFVVFEGLDNSGKTTFCHKIKVLLAKKNLRVFNTFEPGDSKLGKELNTILKESEAPISPISELLLFLSDRFEHLNHHIIPALKEYDVVICDRFFYSTFVYQGFLKGVKRSLILDLHKRLNLFQVIPDLVFFLFTPSFTFFQNSFHASNKPQERFHKSLQAISYEHFDQIHEYYLKTFTLLKEYTPCVHKLNNLPANWELNLETTVKLIIKKWNQKRKASNYIVNNNK